MLIPPESHFGDLYWRYRTKKCECCGGKIEGPDLYGSGRFCSPLCARLRTPENWYYWELEQSGSLEEAVVND
jgi:hypothetical protein